MATEHMEVRGLEFTVDVEGPSGGEPVLCLHGFPQTRHTWRHQRPALARAGYRVLAPDQRGYSPGARPQEVEAYASDELVADALALASAADAPRFHLIGHDWGGQLAWLIAAAHAERVGSLTVLSRPHPAAFARAMREDPAQSERSRHHRAFQEPDMAARLLADGTLRRRLAEQGVAEADVDAYLAPLDSEAALDAALNWYRAAARGAGGLAAADVPPVSVPVLYVWGEADATVGELAATTTAEHVTGPFRFEVLPDVGHFVTDEAPERVTSLVLEHIGAHPL